MSTFPTIDAESTSLSTHVELCAQRYESLDTRLLSLENKLDILEQKVDSLHADVWKVLIGTAGTVLVAAITTFGVIYTHIK